MISLMGGFSFFVVGLTIIGDGWRFRLRWLISLMVDGGFDHGDIWWVTKFRYGEGVGQISMGSDMVNNY